MTSAFVFLTNRALTSVYCFVPFCQNLYLSYTNDDIPLYTNSLAEGYNKASKDIRKFNVALALKPLITIMQTQHQRQREEADKKKNEILPPALKRSKQYIDARGLAGGCVNCVKFDPFPNQNKLSD